MAEDFNSLVATFEGLKGDFKAEVFAGELVKAGFPIDKLYFKTQSTFKRSSGKDIDKVKLHERDNGDEQVILNVNREGLYDMLPEGLFHFRVPRPNKNKEKVLEEIAEIQREENDARAFFGPFENEFFHSRLQLELQELTLLQKSSREKNFSLFGLLFGYDAKIDTQFILPLLYILPIIHKIRGDIKKSEYCLGKFLNQRVEIKLMKKNEQIGIMSNTPVLGTGVLGVNTIVGSSFSSSRPNYLVSILDIPKNCIVDFFKTGKLYRMLEYLIPYLLPMECECKINLHLKRIDRNFYLSGLKTNTYLGYDSYL